MQRRSFICDWRIHRNPLGRIDSLRMARREFTRGHIEVGKDKAKTATRRLAPIQPNLMEWLAPYREGRFGFFESACRRTLDYGREENYRRVADQRLAT